MSVKPIPEGYHSVTPYLIRCVVAVRRLSTTRKRSAQLSCFASPRPAERLATPKSRLATRSSCSPTNIPRWVTPGRETIGGSPVSLMIYVEDVDTVFERAVTAGATVKQALEDKFYGDRSGTIVDPFGHIWHISTHKEDVPAEEMERRAKEHSAAASGGGQ